MRTSSRELYLGIDVGGTKIMAALADAHGSVIARKRMPTPRNTKGEHVVAAIADIVAVLLAEHRVESRQLAGIGLAIPGTVAPAEGKVVFTPNMTLSGMVIAPLLRNRFKVPVYIGNDVNLGTLGEAWRGAARSASSAVGVFVGTGIGAGLVINGQLVTGRRNAAGEIGHMVMQPGGPLCGCGNRGCLEAFASRTAIERDIRDAVNNGRKSAITKLAGNDLAVIKSSVLKRALQQEDELVTQVIRKASETLGYACLNVRHLLDPDMIVLGGGVIEACGDFILPIVQQIVGLHSLPGSCDHDCITMSKLGDDAVALGAVALVKNHAHPSTGAAVSSPAPRLAIQDESVCLDNVVIDYPLGLQPNGRTTRVDLKRSGETFLLTRKSLERLCPHTCRSLIIGVRQPEYFALTPKARAAAGHRKIAVSIVPLKHACDAHARAPHPAALLLCAQN